MEAFPARVGCRRARLWTDALAAFEEAALALTAAVTSAKVEPRFPVEVSCEAPDLELLLVEWLNSVIYEMAVRRIKHVQTPLDLVGLAECSPGTAGCATDDKFNSKRGPSTGAAA